MWPELASRLWIWDQTSIPEARSTTDRLRARHLALGRGCHSHARSCASWEGESWRASALVPASPRSRPTPSPGGRGNTASLETRSPSIWADGGVLGLGGRPSFSVFSEPGGSSSLSSNLLSFSPDLSRVSVNLSSLSSASTSLPSNLPGSSSDLSRVSSDLSRASWNLSSLSPDLSASRETFSGSRSTFLGSPWIFRASRRTFRGSRRTFCASRRVQGDSR